MTATIAPEVQDARNDHTLFGPRFNPNRLQPWKRSGFMSFDDPVPAAEAYESLGPYHVRLQPVYITNPDNPDDLIELDQRAVVAPPKNGGRWETFGMVGRDYGLITPADFVELWDTHVGLPVEAIGTSPKRDTVSIIARVPDAELDIRGDQAGDIVTYIVGTSPMDGSTAASIKMIPYRIVCMNGMISPANSHAFSVSHTRQVRDDLAGWMSHTIDVTRGDIDIFRNHLEQMTDRRVSETELDWILQYTYPIRKRPPTKGPADVVQRKTHRWSLDRESTIRQRDWARENFVTLAGRGMDTGATAGTLYGLYQAIIEVEEHRPGRGTSDKAEAHRANDILFGTRSLNKERAFTAATKVVAGDVNLN